MVRVARFPRSAGPSSMKGNDTNPRPGSPRRLLEIYPGKPPSRLRYSRSIPRPMDSISPETPPSAMWARRLWPRWGMRPRSRERSWRRWDSRSSAWTCEPGFLKTLPSIEEEKRARIMAQERRPRRPVAARFDPAGTSFCGGFRGHDAPQGRGGSTHGHRRAVADLHARESRGSS